MGSSEDQVPEFVRDPLAYAEETRRLAEELDRHVFPPWRWPGWYRRRRVIEERLRNLRMLRRMNEESRGVDGCERGRASGCAGPSP
jgi:hypothetical protein